MRRRIRIERRAVARGRGGDRRQGESHAIQSHHNRIVPVSSQERVSQCEIGIGEAQLTNAQVQCAIGKDTDPRHARLTRERPRTRHAINHLSI